MTSRPRLTGRGWIWLIAALPLAIGCGSSDGRPDGSDADAEDQAEAEDQIEDDSGIEEADDSEDVVPDRTETCDSDTVEECRIEIPEAAGVKNCAVGMRLCEEGVWSPCSREAEINAKLAGDDSAG